MAARRLTVIPDDIICLIYALWDGRKIGMTCHRWAAELSPDKYTAYRKDVNGEFIVSGPTLPNGVRHGNFSCVVLHAQPGSPRVDANCMYWFGNCMVEVSELVHPGKKPVMIQMRFLVNGYIGFWSIIDGMLMILDGDKTIKSLGRRPFGKVVAMVEGYVAKNHPEPGPTTTLSDY